MAIVIYGTGGTAALVGQPLYASAQILTGGAAGGLVAGSGYNLYKMSEIRSLLMEEYGVDPNNILELDIKNLPQEAEELCESYETYQEKNRLYERITQNALMVAGLLMMAQEVYNTGKTLSQILKERKASAETKDGIGSAAVKEIVETVTSK